MTERLSNPNLNVDGLSLIRGCHSQLSPAIPSPPGSVGKVVLDPSLTSISQFALTPGSPLLADVPVKVTYTITGLTNGHVLAVVMGAATTSRSSDGTYSEVITPLADSPSIQFRTGANTDGTLSGFSVDDDTGGLGNGG